MIPFSQSSTSLSRSSLGRGAGWSAPSHKKKYARSTSLFSCSAATQHLVGVNIKGLGVDEQVAVVLLSGGGYCKSHPTQHVAFRQHQGRHRPPTLVLCMLWCVGLDRLIAGYASAAAAADAAVLMVCCVVVLLLGLLESYGYGLAAAKVQW